MKKVFSSVLQFFALAYKNVIKPYAPRVFVCFMLSLLYIPIIVLIVYSFTASKAMGRWTGFTVQLYFDLIANEGIMQAVVNTLVLGVVSSLLATIIGTFAAVGIYYLRKTPKMLVNTMSQITIINADIVTGIAFMLFFVQINKIGLPLPDGFATLIIAHTIITTPYVILSVLPRLSQLNPNLYEAGLDLGATPMHTMFAVIIPQLIPGMINGFALAFTLSLDDFVVSKYNNGSVDTISTMIYTSTKHGVEPAFRALSAIIFCSVLIVLLCVNIFQRKKAKNGYLG